jgi:hypothetical protein
MNRKLLDWFEIWFVPGVNVIPSYLVVVAPGPNGDVAQVIDVLTGKVLYEGRTYEDTYFWLTEDEFEVISGREFANDEFEDCWFEVWHLPNNASIPMRLLVVSSDPYRMAGVSITQDDGKTLLYTGPNYERAQDWLVSRQFQKIDGRVESSDTEVFEILT